MEKVALVCRVTLPLAGMMMESPLKVAVVPEKVVVCMKVALLKRVIPVIPVEGLPLPLDIRVTLVKVTVEALGLPTTNWATGVLDTPGN